ncbi:hypothetical protein MN032_11865 [Agromyces atrinae]|uniref:hypothetical protein n=1 Tax=Agromyces atrinae TaxID=592376 RepID=UPI001F57AAA2|nr:hypothetical protein [Agromyces atrinae]MCI2958390.1 hypothetical protein [Agromyces atrinae]
MKLVEYLAPLSRGNQQSRILATMYFLEATTGTSKFTTGAIRDALAEARTANLKQWNLSARLGSAGHYVHAEGTGVGRTWELTSTGRSAVAAFAPPLPAESPSVAKQSEAAALRTQVAAISDVEARAFASEAVDCLDVGAHRAAIVFMWVAAVHEIQERVWATSTPAAITAAAQSHNPKAKQAKKRDDLSEYNEALLLQVAQDLGVLDKNQHTELKKALDLRNGAGHPNKLRPGEHKAKAHIEEIIQMLF